MSLFRYFLLFSIFCFINACSEKENANSGKPNVLFIYVDDLRPELGCYGNSYIVSPNIDKLAEQGAVFARHFVQVPTCGASRHCLLTGQLPVSVAHLNNNITANTLSIQSETEVPETFVHHLKRNGYYTVGIGKITHHPDGYVYGYTEPKSDIRELPYSWDEMLLDDQKWGSGHNAFFGYAEGTNRNTLKGEVKPYECADVPDEGYPDGLTANLAVRKIQDLKQKGQPFFLGVGFFKPHLPFTAPQKYWDLYNEASLPLSPVPFIPENVNKASLHGSSEFNQYRLGEEKASLEAPVSDEYARKLRHAYFACVSYIDAQVGKVLDELEKQGLAENTVVVLWGDHGWHLGDQLVWGKHTVFEKALSSALIVKAPGKTKGKIVGQVVSTVDIYPTLMELCGVEMPYPADGKSFVPLLENPETGWNEASYSYFRNGISLRTARYRLTRYFRDEQPVIELYDHETDPDETKNIAAEHPDIVENLMPLWEKGNTGLYQKQ